MSKETRTVVARIATAIEREHPDAWVFKVHGSPFQMAGVPDLLVVINGLLIGLEAKRLYPNETPARARRRTTALQRSQIEQITLAGGYATTVVSPREALLHVSRALRERGNLLQP